MSSDSDHLSKGYWNNRYISSQTGWDLAGVSPAIKRWFNQQKNKKLKILVPGAGLGHEVKYGFDHGFRNIYYMDFASKASETFLKKNNTFPKSQILTGDFFKFESKIKFDVIIEQTFFCAQHPNKRMDYVNKTHDLLRNQGILIGLLFNIDFESEGPPYGGRMEEYRDIFTQKFTFNAFELCNYSVKPRKGYEIWMELTKK